MKLNELIDLDRLEQLVADKYVTARSHSRYPLNILNYTPAATGIKDWDNTLSYCRGLVYDYETMEIHAIPFKKFWNYNDPSHPETLAENLPEEPHTILKKMDGSLGIGFFYGAEFIIATRGSFYSEQAVWANDWASKNMNLNLVDIGSKEDTYLFEIIWNRDKKVVNYDFEGLVLLGSIDNSTAIEYLPEWVFKDERDWMGNTKVVTRLISYDRDSYDLGRLQELNTENEEGFVAIWYKGKDILRVKLKFETYKLLHRMYFQTTPEVIWEWCKKKRSIVEALIGADVELLKWAVWIASDINIMYSQVKTESSDHFREAITATNRVQSCDMEMDEKSRRKVFASYATKYRYPGLLFSLYDAKLEQYEESLWKICKPENSRVWRKEEE